MVDVDFVDVDLYVKKTLVCVCVWLWGPKTNIFERQKIFSKMWQLFLQTQKGHCYFKSTTFCFEHAIFLKIQNLFRRVEIKLQLQNTSERKRWAYLRQWVMDVFCSTSTDRSRKSSSLLLTWITSQKNRRTHSFIFDLLAPVVSNTEFKTSTKITCKQKGSDKGRRRKTSSLKESSAYQLL